MTQIPQTIGTYKILDILGGGGMGVVYRAVNPVTHQHVALKTVQRIKEKYLSNMYREIRILSEIQHPGIVRILDWGEEDSLPWYAMELIKGKNLGNYGISKMSRRDFHTDLRDATYSQLPSPDEQQPVEMTMQDIKQQMSVCEKE
ncbi:protein kinase, partial [bacterium]|nr:protein kinase [candidate division CSSED10-310 bacterium]